MKIFSYLYDKSIRWSSHPKAQYYLGGVSFIESSFFPIPPDVMLVTMGIAQRAKVWSYALIATLCSVAGGVLGYIIGYFAMMMIAPYMMASSFWPKFLQVRDWFDHFGIWMVVLAGFTPFPYKIFTISSGAMHMAFPLFFFGSIIGRGLRFFLVCGVIYFAADRFEKHVRRYLDVIGWSVLLISVAIFVWYKWLQ